LLKRLGVIRLDRDRPIKARERFVQSVDAAKRFAAIIEDVGIVRFVRQGAVVTRNRFLEALQSGEHIAASVERACMLGRNR